MRNIFRLIIGVCLSLPSMATAETYSPVLCKEVRETAVQKSLSTLNEVKSWIELVPSDEASYLSEEYAASLNAKSNVRFNTLMSRPYYQAWKLHEAIDKAQFNIQALVALKDASAKHKIQAAADLPYYISNVREEFNAYVDRKPPRAKEMLDSGQIEKGNQILTYTALNLSKYIQCTADLIKD